MRVMIVDATLEPQTPLINLDSDSVATLVTQDCGTFTTRYRFVEDPYEGNIKIRTRRDSSAYFWHFVVHDHNQPVASVQVRWAGGIWRDANWSNSAWAINPGEEMTLPMSVRVVAPDGASITAEDVVTHWDVGTYDGGVQF